MMYSKIGFTSKLNGSTAKLVLSQEKQESMTISELARMFPMSEALKMERIVRGEYFDTWGDAFNS